MPPLAAEPVTILPEQREVLEQLVRIYSTPQQLAVRARILLFAADGVGVRESAQRLEVWPRTVRRWRKRWRQAPTGRPQEATSVAAECGQPGGVHCLTAATARASILRRRPAQGRDGALPWSRGDRPQSSRSSVDRMAGG
jgi:transposase-like protein